MQYLERVFPLVWVNFEQYLSDILVDIVRESLFSAWVHLYELREIEYFFLVEEETSAAVLAVGDPLLHRSAHSIIEESSKLVGNYNVQKLNSTTIKHLSFKEEIERKGDWGINEENVIDNVDVKKEGKMDD